MPDKKNGALFNVILAGALLMGIGAIAAAGALSESVSTHEENRAVHAEGIRESIAAAQATQQHIKDDMAEVKEKVGKIETDVSDIKTSVGILVEMQRLERAVGP